MLLTCAAPCHAACDGAPRIETLGMNMWWVRAARGDADEANRGIVSNLLLVRDGRRLWLVGSGPSPAFARALDCAAKERLGGAITDVISPWPRPELVLGASGLPHARHWAHADVARAMRERCAQCIERLRQRLGAAASDLDAAAPRWPERVLHGTQGRLGPFEWRRVERAPGTAVTLWRAHGVMTAQGLVWSGDVPDLRDSSVAAMRSATEALARFAGRETRLLGEQGEPAPARVTIDAHLRYWNALEMAIAREQAAGSDGIAAATPLAGLDLKDHAAHALNWQRAWRQAEEAALEAPR